MTESINELKARHAAELAAFREHQRITAERERRQVIAWLAREHPARYDELRDECQRATERSRRAARDRKRAQRERDVTPADASVTAHDASVNTHATAEPSWT